MFAVFVHDFVVVERPFGELLAELPFLLESELAELVGRLWQYGPPEREGDPMGMGPPTVLIGTARERLDSVVYPVAWNDARSLAVPGLEADLELSAIDRVSCDLHILGRCAAGEDLLPAASAGGGPPETRAPGGGVVEPHKEPLVSPPETVHAVRRLLEHLKEQLETPPMLRSFPAER